MRQKIRKIALILIVAILVMDTGLSWITSRAKGVPILAYHMVQNVDELYAVSCLEFEEQMEYLHSQGYTAISLKEMMDSFAGRGTLPDKPIVITFDDGYEDNYVNALPIMEKYNWRGTVFVLSGSVGQSEYLSWEQINEMQQRGTEIGSHTANHVALSEVDFAEREAEVRVSKEVIEQNIKTNVEFLAYPYGKYGIDMAAILQQSSYRGACGGKPGLNTLETAPYYLKRIGIPKPRYGLLEFKARLLRAQLYSLMKKK